MRSLSPSRTFTCTLTVSPAFIAGRSVSCVFSTISSALILRLLQFHQYAPLFVVERRFLEQIRPATECPRQRFPLPPPADFRVISRQQHVGHAIRADFR